MLKPEALSQKLQAQGYVMSPDQALTVAIALHLEKPLLIEGPAGVGKTELAKVLSQSLKAPLIRLQCYEGLGEEKALYEWNYSKQLLHIQADKKREWNQLETEIFSEEYLLERPLLKAIRNKKRVVLLIDELDRVDEEFEAFLFELLSDFQITIPEMGTVMAKHKPIVMLTSNETRELSEALRRRCIYLYITFPTREREKEIVLKKVPGISEKLAEQVVTYVQALRKRELKKPPSVSETLDWARSLQLLGINHIDDAVVHQTAPLLLKNKADLESVHQMDKIVRE
ncbi:MoxR family ATPase [Candidatus Acetothermia bacterium]|nr:MoxR family ATPase [Candidatus Acetothermia bacterium]